MGIQRLPKEIATPPSVKLLTYSSGETKPSLIPEGGKCENMVNYMLYISGELENLTNFQPRGGVDDPDFTYYFKLKCENCGEVTEKETCVSLNETLPLPKKGTTNLIQKCKFCKREGTVTMIPSRGSPLTNDFSETGKYAPLMAFDCRGFEPLDFVFSSGWKAESLEGTKFEDIDLSGGDYSEYDEKGECPVMISNVRAMFKVVDLSKKNL